MNDIDCRLRVMLTASAVAAAICASVVALRAQGNYPAQLETGEQIFKSACIACHGPDATGMPKSISGFEPPRTFPDKSSPDSTCRNRPCSSQSDK